MNKTRSVSNCDIIDSKLEEHQLCGSKQCPSCGQKLQVKPDWVGLPAGVKFDPTDPELMQHLEAKLVIQGGRESKSHPLLDEFIPTIEGEDGICYTHPQNLPGVRKDGLSRHFFHRPSKAYTTGTRKRRKVLIGEHDLGETRWHKTGKTRPVMVNGRQKGCKKILVLYTNFGKNRKPVKTNWVMHQYHLGKNEEEKEGELVVSKVFYQTQPRQCNWLSDQRGVSGNKNTRDSKDVSRPRISGCGAVDVQQLKHDRFGFVPFEKSFGQARNNIGEASIAREAQGAAGTCGVRDMGQHHVTQEHEFPQHHVTNEHQYPHDQIANAAAVDMSSISSSIILSPTPTVSSIILDEDHSFNLPRIMLPNQNFQQQQQHDKVGGIRSASGLDELIMACTSSTHHTKQESSIKNPQEAEWFKYSAIFWPDQYHHHG